jgi:hypothetical protein
MIALLLVAQLSAQTLVQPQAAESAPPQTSGELIRALPQKGVCPGAAAHMEVSLAQPTALYRRGDRPAKDLRDWVAYPQAQICLVEAAR